MAPSLSSDSEDDVPLAVRARQMAAAAAGKVKRGLASPRRGGEMPNAKDWRTEYRLAAADWRKNWRTYVTNVPKKYRKDFKGRNGEYTGDSELVAERLGSPAGPLGNDWTHVGLNFYGPWECHGYDEYQRVIRSFVTDAYKERAAWEEAQKSKVAFLLNAFLRRAEPLPLCIAKKVLQEAKVFCWRPGTDPKDWDDWVKTTDEWGKNSWHFEGE